MDFNQIFLMCFCYILTVLFSVQEYGDSLAKKPRELDEITRPRYRKITISLFLISSQKGQIETSLQRLNEKNFLTFLVFLVESALVFLSMVY